MRDVERQLTFFDCMTIQKKDYSFLCGYCMWEQYKELEQRIAMAESLKDGDNVCSDCGFNVSVTYEEREDGKRGRRKIAFSGRSKH